MTLIYTLVAYFIPNRVCRDKFIKVLRSQSFTNMDLGSKLKCVSSQKLNWHLSLDLLQAWAWAGFPQVWMLLHPACRGLAPLAWLEVWKIALLHPALLGSFISNTLPKDKAPHKMYQKYYSSHNISLYFLQKKIQRLLPSTRNQSPELPLPSIQNGQRVWTTRPVEVSEFPQEELKFIA